MKITIIQGHPDAGVAHLCHAIAEAYAAGAEQARHTVRRIDLGALDVPFLRTKDEFDHGSLPEALVQAQGDIGWAEHVVLVYPLWLGEMPALVKAFFEQVLRPGFAFEVKRHGWVSALGGRTARVIVTMGMPAFVYRWFFGAHSLRSLRRNILTFVGIKPVRTTLLGSVETVSAERKQRWFEEMRRLGARGV